MSELRECARFHHEMLSSVCALSDIDVPVGAHDFDDLNPLLNARFLYMAARTLLALRGSLDAEELIYLSGPQMNAVKAAMRHHEKSSYSLPGRYG